MVLPGLAVIAGDAGRVQRVWCAPLAARAYMVLGARRAVRMAELGAPVIMISGAIDRLGDVLDKSHWRAENNTGEGRTAISNSVHARVRSQLTSIMRGRAVGDRRL